MKIIVRTAINVFRKRICGVRYWHKADIQRKVQI